MKKSAALFYKISIGLAGSAVIFTAPAQALIATTTFPVTATVVKACSVSAGALAFGSYDPTSTTPTDGTATLSVLCTVGTSFTVGLNVGTTAGGTVTVRKMTDGTNTINYGLYQDSGHATNWGNTPGTDTPTAVTAPITATPLTVYGRIPITQNVPVGSYTDTMTVTVTY